MGDIINIFIKSWYSCYICERSYYSYELAY